MAALRPFPLFVVVTCFFFAAGKDKNEEVKPLGSVSIDDVIDLDALPSEVKAADDVRLTSSTDTDGGATDTTVGHGTFIAPVIRPPSPPLTINDVIKPSLRSMPMTSDDEDMEISGDGSGSGDDMTDINTVVRTLTSVNVSTTPTSSGPRDKESVDFTSTVADPLELVVEGGRTSTEKMEWAVAAENDVTVSNVVYNGDVWPPKPVKEQRDYKKEHRRWSPWIRTNVVTEVRVRTCAGTSEPCNGTEAELRQCDVENKTCDVINAFVTPETHSGERGQLCSDKGSADEGTADRENSTLRLHGKPHHTPTPPSSQDTHKNDRHDPEPNPCAYSLYDVKRGKFVAAQWSLSRLVTQAKVKKWCSSPDRFLVLHSPFSHCRRYFDDLCHVSIRCKGRRTPPRTHGDLTDRCWRQFMYANQLPRGLTGSGANVYLLCQRFAAMSALGQTAGPGIHFATVFDTKGRAPVASMVRVTQLGDLAWPHTPYFIEHGLIEDTQNAEWLLQKPKAGMVQLKELQMCNHDYSCQLGAHQALPSDYSATTYRPAPLLWPELLGPDPWSATASMTLTNAAPMHAGLYPLWHRAVLHLRQFAAQQCGVPHVPAKLFRSRQRGYGAAGAENWRKDGPAMYVISGVVASRDPIESIGNDINVPSMFWMAVCCVAARNTTTTPNHHLHHHDHHDAHSSSLSSSSSSSGGNHASFSIYASNAGSRSLDERQGQVVVAPVAELEQLLEDLRMRSSMEEDVSQVRLFPGSEGACSHPASDLSSFLRL